MPSRGVNPAQGANQTRRYDFHEVSRFAYDMNWVSRQIMSRMLRTDTVTLVNLVSGRKTVPEFLGAACQPAAIAAALNDLIADPSLRAAQLEAMSDTILQLGKGDTPPGLRAAHAVLDGLDVG